MLAVRFFCDFLWRDFASSVPSGRILKAGRVLNQLKRMKIINRFFDKKIVPFFKITYFCYRIIQPEQPPCLRRNLLFLTLVIYIYTGMAIFMSFVIRNKSSKNT